MTDDSKRPVTFPTNVVPPPARIVRSENAFLVVLTGPLIGDMYKLESGHVFVIGREEGAHILISDEGVSRWHARISIHETEALLEDMESRNGTYVNGTRVRSRSLTDGDKIQLGARTTMMFTLTDSLEADYQLWLAAAALRDPLTGLYNRRHFDERLSAEYSAARRHGRPLALLIIDIDHFKAVNDAAGHAAGDEALKMVACSIQQTLRKEDILARYGGEEFVVLARETSLVGAEQLAQRIRRNIEKSRCEFSGKSIQVTVSIGLTVSIGVAEFSPKLGEREFFEAADRALYEAKHRGRNCVVATQFDDDATLS